MIRLIALLIVLAFSTSSFALVVGKVDVQKVLTTVKEGQKAQDLLKKKFDEKQKLISKEEEKIKAAQTDFEKKMSVMNDAKKQESDRNIQQMIAKLQEKSMGFQKELQDLEAQYKKPILNRLKDLIESVSKSEGVEITFETSTAPILYAQNVKDLTDTVINNYDKKYPAK